MAEQTLIPVGAEWLAPLELRIQWSDGHSSIYAMQQLRDACPCATCKAERAAGPHARDLLKPVPTLGALESPTIEPVGRYALRIAWRDGHSTGIYPFTYLRSLCRCEECCAGGAEC